MPTASEIQSPRLEYLPSVDTSEHHLTGVEGLLDRHFRLLREDTVGQLRDAVRVEFDRRRGSNTDQFEEKHAPPHGARTFVYRDAQLRDLKFHKFRGLDLVYEFEQPHAVQGMDPKDRRTWWQFSKRLQQGALVCLVDHKGSPIFCSVTETGLALEDGDAKKQATQSSAWLNVFENPEKAYVVLSLVETDETNLDLVLDGYITGRGRGREILVEFPGVLLPSFRPTLQALQRMSDKADLPFAKLLAPPSYQLEGLQDIPPPAYSLRRGFRYDLRCLLKDDTDLFWSPREHFDPKVLQNNSALDEAQAVALVDALSRSLALIQGAPGMGKSFTGIAIIKVLLASRVQARLGPIICVCYTNHALDQLLEHLHEHGVDQIVRVGSRSKSDVLQNLNLRQITREMEQTKTERHATWRFTKAMEGHLSQLNDLIGRFSQATSSPGVRAYLLATNQNHFDELFGDNLIDEEGFQKVRYHPFDPLQDWLSKLDHNIDVESGQRPLEVLQASALFSMSAPERRILYASWVSNSREKLKSMIVSVLDHYVETKTEIDKIRQELDLRCLQQAKVIGVTTSGLARITDVLGRLEARVLVCEEAGEVLEAQTVTTLLPSIEHAILIGDHLQLRPQIQNYELQSENPRGKQFSLDVSLFERLVAPPEGPAVRIPFSVLETQRRMHPSIAQLIRSTLYPNLKDADAMKKYPEVSGMRKRLFWFDHQQPEAGPGDGNQLLATSHSNDFEVDMTTALVGHLVRQGIYKSQDIAVLTPYLGQLRKLRQTLGRSHAVVIGDRDIAEMESQGMQLDAIEHQPSISKTTLLKALRVATIDNFQGEEANVIVISLVRSNDQNKCGFLKTRNRINVLLSRAKHGMYIIGNAQTSRHVPMWAEVLSILEENDNFGQALELSCPRHSDTVIKVKTADDFSRFAPEGGCDLKCNQRLQCGHACINKCHSDVMHAAVKCLEDCTRPIQGCDVHPCPSYCGDACPPNCTVTVRNILLPCGHVQDLLCHEAQDLSSARCSRLVKVDIGACGHTVEVDCYKTRMPDVIECTADCGSILDCQHICKRPCRSCRTRDGPNVVTENHGKCQQPCHRPYHACSHRCIADCHGAEACPLCQAPCDVRCSHSACKKKCYEACTPCAEERCASSCPHHRCEMPCAVPCNWTPCSKRCAKVLSCGHRCPSVCGETCPSEEYCHECCSEGTKNVDVDFIIGQTYREIDLDNDPCIFPRCGHILTMSNMDGHFDMAHHYKLNFDGSIEAIKTASAPFSSENMKKCPKCRGSLREVSRYGRIVRRALLDESSKRLIVWAHREYLSLEDKFRSAEDLFSDPQIQCAVQGPIHLEKSRDDQFWLMSRLPVFSTLYKEAMQLRRSISRFVTKVRKEEQPFQQVWTMVQNIRRRKGIIAQNIPDDITTVQMRHYVLALTLSLRLDLALLSKILSLRQSGGATTEIFQNEKDKVLVVELAANRQDCVDLISAAADARQPAQQAEGHILFARYAALESSVNDSSHGAEAYRSSPADEALSGVPKAVELREQGFLQLNSASRICEKYPGQTRGLLAEIEAIETMLRGAFYGHVTNDERRQVLTAMAQEFHGSGHWWV